MGEGTELLKTIRPNTVCSARFTRRSVSDFTLPFDFITLPVFRFQSHRFAAKASQVRNPSRVLTLVPCNPPDWRSGLGGAIDANRAPPQSSECTAPDRRLRRRGSGVSVEISPATRAA